MKNMDMVVIIGSSYVTINSMLQILNEQANLLTIFFSHLKMTTPKSVKRGFFIEKDN